MRRELVEALKTDADASEMCASQYGYENTITMCNSIDEELYAEETQLYGIAPLPSSRPFKLDNTRQISRGKIPLDIARVSNPPASNQGNHDDGGFNSSARFSRPSTAAHTRLSMSIQGTRTRAQFTSQDGWIVALEQTAVKKEMEFCRFGSKEQ